MVKVRLQIIYIFLLFQMSNSLLISAKVRLIFLLCIPPQKIKYFWPRRDSNTQPSDLESDALPLRHGVTVYWWWDFGLEKREGSTEIWTRIAGFKVQSANHYTIEPWLVSQIFKVGKDHKCLSHSMYSVNFVFGVQISYFADIISGLSWGKYDIWTRKK